MSRVEFNSVPQRDHHIDSYAHPHVFSLVAGATVRMGNRQVVVQLARVAVKPSCAMKKTHEHIKQ